jgi:hypothetical protein
MDADRDDICALMERGIYGEYDRREDYLRAEALWGKWCDPKRVECRECGGRGESMEEWYEECPNCYGTGKVRPPTPPPPPKPPTPEYTIASGGILNGSHRTVVLRNGTPVLWTSGLSLDEAWEEAELFIAFVTPDSGGQ